MKDLTRLAELFEGIEQMYLLGGEPLLHPEVEAFVREARRIFPATRLSLMTNGILVTRMPESFWETLHATETRLCCATPTRSTSTMSVSTPWVSNTA